YKSSVNYMSKAYIEVRGATGGDEAKIWASDLLRMYLRYATKKGWKWTQLDDSTLLIDSDGVYSALKNESGVHRVQRVPSTEKRGRIHTSTATVLVLPEISKVDVNINPNDLDWQFFRASTQGGQNVQKVSTAVRVKHKPTDITVTSQQERSQEQNRKIALNLLRARLWARKRAMREKKVKELKGEYRPASWGNQIRSYVLHPYKMVKDLRTKVEVSDADSVLDGDLDQFIDAELKLQTA
ncbi:PCRF domain-containing protein, partial [Patescibacteria group bacterium]|nr:PCRF domain-containing protein [Patescibacteria group bacterium]